MADYPFDEETCEARFTVKPGDEEYIKLVLENMTFIGSFDVMSYFISDIVSEKRVQLIFFIQVFFYQSLLIG